jgi:hypothetical protein
MGGCRPALRHRYEIDEGDAEVAIIGVFHGAQDRDEDAAP